MGGGFRSICFWNKETLAEIDSLYASSNLPTDQFESLEAWRTQRDAFRKRLVSRNEKMGQKVDDAFKKLGGLDFYRSERTADDNWWGHGLPDLLAAWDFAYRLDKPRRYYEEV
jgi:hypothetical protein